jgi:hypothetical protein
MRRPDQVAAGRFPVLQQRGCGEEQRTDEEGGRRRFEPDSLRVIRQRADGEERRADDEQRSDP